MNLAGFCRNCLSNWMKEEADAKGVAVSKDESREAVYGMPYEDVEGEASGHGHPGAVGRDEEGSPRALISFSLSFVMAGLVAEPIHVFLAATSLRRGCPGKPGHDGNRMAVPSCGRAVDERDVALTQGAAILRVNPEKAPCGNACGA